MRARPVRLPHPQLIEFLEPYGEATTRLALAARDFVLDQEPSAIELIYDAYNAVSIGFSLSDGLRDAFCHVAVYSQYVNLGFNSGAMLRDPERRLQGTGKMIRHLRIERKEDLRNPEIREFVRLAVAHARSQASPRIARKPVPQAIIKAIYPKKRRPNVKSSQPKNRPI